MTANTKNLTPAIAIHPGEILKDELDARDIKQKDFAEIIGIQPTQLNEIVNGKRGINTELSVIIGRALKMNPEIWQNLQSKYELEQIKVDKKAQERLLAIDKWHMIEDYIPYKFFKKQEVISGDPVKDINIIKSVYKVNNLEDLVSIYSQPQFARFRKSEKLSEDKVNIIGWVKLVEYYADQQIVDDFEVSKFDELIQNLKLIIRKNSNTVAQSKNILKGYGIKLVVKENPPKCPVDGIAFWSGGKPAIGMTLRHKRIDNFAFTLFHELAHICKHLINGKTPDVDINLNICTTNDELKEENEANVFAQNKLLDPKRWHNFFSNYSTFHEGSLIEFAEQQNIHPAIVKGRLCYELNYYKFKTEKISSELK